MKQVLYTLVAASLLACNSPAHQDAENKTIDNNTPLYTVSTLKQRGLKGSIQTIITQNYSSAQLSNGQWVRSDMHRYINNLTERFDEMGNIIWSGEIKEMASRETTHFDTVTYYYTNNKLERAEQTYIIREPGQQDMVMNIKISYNFTGPYSYKKTTEFISNYRVTAFFTDDYTLDKSYHTIKRVKTIKEDTNSDKAEKHTQLHTYSSDYNSDTTKNENMLIISVETVLGRDNKGNPNLMLYWDNKAPYIYDIRYEYHQ